MNSHYKKINEILLAYIIMVCICIATAAVGLKVLQSAKTVKQQVREKNIEVENMIEEEVQ